MEGNENACKRYINNNGALIYLLKDGIHMMVGGGEGREGIVMGNFQIHDWWW